MRHAWLAFCVFGTQLLTALPCAASAAAARPAMARAGCCAGDAPTGCVLRCHGDDGLCLLKRVEASAVRAALTPRLRHWAGHPMTHPAVTADGAGPHRFASPAIPTPAPPAKRYLLACTLRL